ILDTPVDSVGVNFTDLQLNTGHGSDTVNVLNTQNDVFLIINGQGGTDSVNIGNGRSLLGIHNETFGTEVHNTGGFTDLTLDGSADNSSQNVTMAADTIDGLVKGEIFYNTNELRSLNVKGGRGGNTFTINDTF